MQKYFLRSKYWSQLKYNQFYFNIFTLLLMMGFKSSQALAQKIPSIKVDRNTIVRPHIIQGTSVGKVVAKEISRTESTATGYCDGYVQQQPNHLLNLGSFFEFLRLEVKSSVDTTILIKGPGGVWCNDDAGSANPIIEGQWQPGVYEIWVGSYQNEISNQYQIEITAQ